MFEFLGNSSLLVFFTFLGLETNTSAEEKQFHSTRYLRH